MKFLSLALLLLSFLVGCTGPVDPYQRIADAQADIDATKRARVDGQKATAKAELQATQDALATLGAQQAEIDLANARYGATSQALDLQVHAMEATAMAARSTQSAAQFEIAVQETRQASQATATAMAISMEQEQEQADREQLIGWLLDIGKLAGALVLLVALAAVAVIGIVYLWKLQDWAITWVDRKKHIFHSPEGTFWVEYDDDGRPSAVLVSDMNYFRRRPQLRGGNMGDAQAVENVEWISPSVTASPMPSKEMTDDEKKAELALQVVEAAIEHFETGEAMTIPRWSVLKVSAGTWETGVNYLKDLGLADNAPGKKTVTFAKLGEILYRLQHSPTLS